MRGDLLLLIHGLKLSANANSGDTTGWSAELGMCAVDDDVYHGAGCCVKLDAQLADTCGCHMVLSAEVVLSLLSL